MIRVIRLFRICLRQSDEEREDSGERVNRHSFVALPRALQNSQRERLWDGQREKVDKGTYPRTSIIENKGLVGILFLQKCFVSALD